MGALRKVTRTEVWDALKEEARPKVLLCATMWWPLSARLAMAFLGHGCRVSGVCPPGHPLRFVSGLDGLYLYKGLNSAGSLKAAILAAKPDLIVPCDDGVVWQLHELHARVPELRALIEHSLGAKEGYAEIRSRGAFLAAAAELGIRVPRTERVSAESDLQGWCVDAPAVLKLDGTWGGSGVAIVRSQVDAVAAFHALSRPVNASVAWKRRLVNHDPLALWSWRRRETPNVTVQEFVAGRPANTMFACWKGEVLAIVTVEVISAQGATGAATVVRLIQNAEIEQAARLLAKRFLLHGFHGLDFMLAEATGAAYLIELNPRTTQLGHLRLPVQGDLAGAISARLLERPLTDAKPEEAIQGDTVAFFPQALNWNPKSAYLHRGYHDVPWEEPALFRELLKPSWPERQLLNRLYHGMRPPRKQEEVKF